MFLGLGVELLEGTQPMNIPETKFRVSSRQRVFPQNIEGKLMKHVDTYLYL